MLDGTTLTARQIVSAVLTELGCNVKLQSMTELLELIQVIVCHRVRVESAPVLIIENIDRMTPGALQVLCAFAEFSTQDRSAIQVILTGRPRSRAVLGSQEMANVLSRTSCFIELGPFTVRESVNYLHRRLAAIGIRRPDGIFSLDVCERLHEVAGGWPGLLNIHAMQAIERANSFPVRVSDTIEERQTAVIEQKMNIALADNARKESVLPRLIVSRFGKIIREYDVENTRMIVGRSEYADVMIDDDYVSSFHALLLPHTNGLVIVDLNSSNGNSGGTRRGSKPRCCITRILYPLDTTQLRSKTSLLRSSLALPGRSLAIHQE